MTEPDDEVAGEATNLESTAFAAHGFDELLSYLNESRGFDGTIYKRAGLERRVRNRALSLKLTSFSSYGDYLQVHPDEFEQLFNGLLINATSFFRDPSVWDHVASTMLPSLLENKREPLPIRIWSAGCATGQEAYTIAMVLAETLGTDALMRRVKIYATDIDLDALNRARLAAYTAKEVSGVPQPLLNKYFEQSAGRYTFLKQLRRAVIFGKHDLFSDAPISKIDLLLCRNTLMYFNADAQARILANLHFSLSDAGVLLLGKAEMLLTHSTLFAPLDLKRRLFSKVSHAYVRARAAAHGPVPGKPQKQAQPRTEESVLRAVAFEHSPIAQLGVDATAVLTIANDAARRLLGIAPTDIGRTVRDIGASRRCASLLAGIEQCQLERRALHIPTIEWRRPGEDTVYFDLHATPATAPNGGAAGVSVSLIDVTAPHRLQEELLRVSHELESTYEELQSTSEELETTNEELQSTVEELETTNEELQSTNEEIETTNEELQSTNEELQGMNAELQVRTGDLGRVNLYFESVLSSIRSAVVVLDSDLQVQIWSARAQELWGLRSEEVIGKHLLNLDIGLPVQELLPIIRSCLAGERDFAELTLAATNRRGRAIRCRVLMSRLTQRGTSHGVIQLMDDCDLLPALASDSAFAGASDGSPT